MGQKAFRPRDSVLSCHMSPQDSKLVFHEALDANITQLPSFTTTDQLLNWANTKGSIASVAELNNPQSIFLRLDQGLPPQLPL